MKLGTLVGLGPADFVLDGNPGLPSLKGGAALSPIFGPCPLWQNGWMDQGGTWHGDGPWSRTHCARASQLSSQKGGEAPSPIFSPFVFWPYLVRPNMAGWMKISLDMEVGISPGNFVLHGDPAHPVQKGHSFRPMSIVAKRLYISDTTWHGGRPQPRRHFWATVCETVRPMLSDRCSSVPFA